EGFSKVRRIFISRKTPSRCIFFLRARRAWSTLLSRTRTCTAVGSPFAGRANRFGRKYSRSDSARYHKRRGSVNRLVGTAGEPPAPRYWQGGRARPRLGAIELGEEGTGYSDAMPPG